MLPDREMVFPVAFCLLMLEIATCLDTPVVSTNLGKIVGERVASGTSIVDRFLGVPYVKAPIGRLRFRNPVQHPGWGHEVRKAKEFGAHCPQTDRRIGFYYALGLMTFTNLNRSEDCLFLNVYVPRGVDVLRQAGESLAILIHFHGGSFNAGTGATFNGGLLASEGDVIVVTINYRIGFLGFYATGTADARGNYGLFDQHMAIKWVQDNAQAFGGDPSRITLVGDSAGGASVDFQMVSPLNNGLIQGGIAVSGSSLAPWSLADTLNISVEFAKLAGCDQRGPRGRLRCLRAKSADDLASVVRPGVSSPDMRPVIDGVFLPKHPRDLLRDNVTSGLRYMVGSTNDDGSIYTLPFVDNPPTVAWQRFLVRSVSPVLYGIDTDVADDAFARSILHENELFQDPMAAMEILTKATQMNTDLLFGIPAEETARLNTAGGAATYKYELSVRLGYPTSFFPKAAFIRAEHVDTRLIYFGLFEEHPEVYNLTAEELALSRSVRTYWANFAKNGDPNVGDAVSVQWPQYTSESRQYVNLDTTITMETFDRERQYLFSVEVLPEIIKVAKAADKKPKRGCLRDAGRRGSGPRFLTLPFARKRGSRTEN